MRRPSLCAGDHYSPNHQHPQSNPPGHDNPSAIRRESFGGYPPTESPTSKLNPHPVRSSSKWRVSFSDSGPLSRRLTSIVAGKGFVREYGGAATVALASVIAAAFSGDL